ncbi:MAG: 30S ribosomal protein S8e [Candidatus Woesearchaeota archaeon]|nr:MAG: 30S ribosomal protein S8e [Candidatus Woesearchaeota archaeon]
MSIVQNRSRRKPSGGRNRASFTKRVHALGRLPTHTTVGQKRESIIRTRGGDIKIVLLSSEEVNVYDSKEKKYKMVKIKNVVDNPANRNFVRRNIITKGTIIDTEIGKVRVTNRPGQEGAINGVLVQ